MADVRNNDNQFSGEYMVQDSDHMSGIVQPTEKANRGVRQSEQSQQTGRQQGSGDNAAERRRQAH